MDEITLTPGTAGATAPSAAIASQAGEPDEASIDFGTLLIAELTQLADDGGADTARGTADDPLLAQSPVLDPAAAPPPADWINAMAALMAQASAIAPQNALPSGGRETVASFRPAGEVHPAAPSSAADDGAFIAALGGTAANMEAAPAGTLEISTPSVVAASHERLPDAAATLPAVAASHQRATIHELPAMEGGTPRSAIPVTHIDTPVTQAEWGSALGQRVVWMIGRDAHAAEMHLNPPHLGPIDVVLSIDNDRTHIAFVAPHAVVRDAIETALPALREALAGSGITLGNATVSAEASSHADSGPHAPADDRNPGRPDAADATNGADVASAEVRLTRGLVDIFA